MEPVAVILSGGQSRRMGRDKGTILFENEETLIARLVRRYGAEFDGVYVSVNEAGRFDTAGAPELVDLRPGQGPMAGLETAFARTDADLVFLTAACAQGASSGLTTSLGVVPANMLSAISCGAVFMGANTYIGNAPNFMVKSISDENGIHMPSFFGYMFWSVRFLIPIFVLDTLIFFW